MVTYVKASLFVLLGMVVSGAITFLFANGVSYMADAYLATVTPDPAKAGFLAFITGCLMFASGVAVFVCYDFGE